MTRSLSFGWYPERLDLHVGDITISTLPNLTDTVPDVVDSTGVERDWIYAPPQQVRVIGQGPGAIRTMPYASRVFGLPKTHRIEHASASHDDHIVFHIWSLSFFLGIRLTSTPAGFLDAASLRPGALVDFIPVRDCEERAIALTETFWLDHRGQPEPARLVSAIIHALFIAQTPQRLMFERFTYLYMAIDACFALAKLRTSVTPPRTHGERIAWMCQTLGLATPTWADPGAAGGSAISALRNQTFHEALFLDQPLGFAAHDLTATHELMTDLEGLICRLLIALLGGKSDYIQTSLSTRQKHGLELQ